ncbi:UNVERIFIED_CONTAM: Homeobox protein BEL1 [Sesamum radiatum]|uniref:Homeobox protein BEL1 n=1 Tax=Sesamum radiatum TaxID=300843 RepID=A0AAW2TUC5_SESRA
MAGAGGVTSTGYCYSDDASSSGNPNIQTHLVSQLQSFDSNPEIYNLTASMGMIGFPPKNSILSENTSVYHHQDSTSGTLMVNSSPWNHHHHHHMNRLLLVEDHDHQDPSLRCAVLGDHHHERPSQGLSLSLSSSNNLGLQSFALRQNDDFRFGPSSSRSVNTATTTQFQLRNSKYLGPAQELLTEFCNLGSEKTSKLKAQKSSELEDDESDDVKKQSLYSSFDLLELQKRKTKLLQMLDEVERRYKHYRDQMKAVVQSFESVAGNGSAEVYSAMASRAMSRHFKCLKDGILSQIKATKKAMGEKDSAAPGTTKGETPRLRILDQTLRQQRAFQQMSMIENPPWRPQRGLPERSVSVLRSWLFEHFLHPIHRTPIIPLSHSHPPNFFSPCCESKVQPGKALTSNYISSTWFNFIPNLLQVSNWFINARVRLWKPMVEEMYLEDLKEGEDMRELDGGAAAANHHENGNQNPAPGTEDQKPTQDQLIRIDSDYLSSIINTPGKNDPKAPDKSLGSDHQQHHEESSFSRVGDEYGTSMQFDFSSYSQQTSGSAVFYGGGGGVSLTLGLQQNGASGGVSLAFSPATQSSLFYPRSSDNMEDCQTVHQYSLLDSEHQNLPYRNLMGAQLLHDLAG